MEMTVTVEPGRGSNALSALPLERLLEDDPRHVEMLISLGNLHSQQGRPEEARSLWEQTWDPALRAGPV